MQRNFARPQRLDSFKFLFGLVTLLGVVAAVKPAYALPTKDQVPQAAPLPIDGEWETTVWGQHLTFRLEKGRWYATTAYTVALLWPVHVDDVTTQDVRATAAGRYVGYDLVLSGKWTGTLLPNGNLKVHSDGALTMFDAIFTPMSLDNRAWYDKERSAMSVGGDVPSTTAPTIAATLPAPPPTAAASPGKIGLDTAPDGEYPGKVKVCLSNMTQSGKWEALGINTDSKDWTIEADGVGAWTCTDAKAEPTTIRFFRADATGNKSAVLSKDYDLTHYANQRLTFSWSD